MLLADGNIQLIRATGDVYLALASFLRREGTRPLDYEDSPTWRALYDGRVKAQERTVPPEACFAFRAEVSKPVLPGNRSNFQWRLAGKGIGPKKGKHAWIVFK